MDARARATEEQEQATLFAWAALELRVRPDLGMLFAIPNGGWRAKSTAAAMRRTGTKAGVPDMCLPVARRGYHGLYIELKRSDGGRVSKDQQAWLERLRQQGYAAVVCCGCDSAINVITNYLDSRLDVLEGIS